MDSADICLKKFKYKIITEIVLQLHVIFLYIRIWMLPLI